MKISDFELITKITDLKKLPFMPVEDMDYYNVNVDSLQINKRTVFKDDVLCVIRTTGEIVMSYHTFGVNNG